MESNSNGNIQVKTEPSEIEVEMEANVEESNLNDKRQKENDEKFYRCDACMETFCNYTELKAHVDEFLMYEVTHPPLTTYSCMKCKKKPFVRKNRQEVKFHVVKKHREKVHECSECDKKFPRMRALKQHQKTHTCIPREKTHECTYCDKSFFRWDKLRNHIRTHTGEKPFKCDLCGKFFAHKKDVDAHTKKERSKPLEIRCDRELPFKCDFCGRGFEKNCLAVRHMVAQNQKKIGERCDDGKHDKLALNKH